MTSSWTGLHPGAVIATGPGARCTGGVGALLSTEPGAGPTHLVTAGHLFPPLAEGLDAQVFVGAGEASAATHIGALARNLLDDALPRDVALIELTENGRALCTEDGPPLMGVEPTSAAGRWRARLWLANKQRDTALVWVRLTPMRAKFRAPLRPEGYVLRDLLSTSAPLSRHGDSGSPLLTAAARGRALGLLVGRKGVHGVFEPLDRALAALTEGRDIALFLYTKDAV